ncbi:hypothetical protein CASFOL_014533 [Castilleja foliolosa]|uniref:F-box domain-containing protein n=1 Tax=Castilleja foliolosa TaxID=1961234 RepID=A0ABD3DN46_9LAMI
MEGYSYSASPPWIELPREVTENILSRLGQVEILKNAQRVCTTWRSVCSEPSMWRVIHIKNFDVILCPFRIVNRIGHLAVDRSKGELIDINIEGFCRDDLLHYISERESFMAAVSKFQELEEMHVFYWSVGFHTPFITAKKIEAIGISCPKLTSFTFMSHEKHELPEMNDNCALTIAKNMPNLQHLCLDMNMVNPEGLEVILNGCPNLELLNLLNLQYCFKLYFQGGFRKISFKRICDMKNSDIDVMCLRAIDLSKGELVEINIEYFGNDDLLHYISQRSSNLKCLRLRYCNYITTDGLTASVKIFSELEELHLYFTPGITANVIEVISISCPMLKSFTFNNCSYNNHSYRSQSLEIDNSCALTIAKNMPNLQHLCLIWNMLSNEGLKAILNGCLNLESLDLRKCFKVDLQGEFGKMCLERIKYLKCPGPTDDYSHDMDEIRLIYYPYFWLWT